MTKGDCGNSGRNTRLILSTTMSARKYMKRKQTYMMLCGPLEIFPRSKQGVPVYVGNLWLRVSIRLHKVLEKPTHVTSCAEQLTRKTGSDRLKVLTKNLGLAVLSDLVFRVIWHVRNIFQ